MYFLLMVFTVFSAYFIYRAVIADDRSFDKWFYLSCGAIVCDIGVLIWSFVRCANGALSGPLLYIYRFVVSLKLHEVAAAALLAVVEFFRNETVISVLQVVFFIVCCVAVVVCIIASRRALRRME